MRQSGREAGGIEGWKGGERGWERGERWRGDGGKGRQREGGM